MYGLEPTHLIIVAIVVLVLFGPKRLPELAKGLGQGIRDFKKALHHEEEPPKEEPTAMATHAEEPKSPAASEPPASATNVDPAAWDAAVHDRNAPRQG